MTRVALIDYGIGNLRNVYKALDVCGALVDVVDKPTSLNCYSHVVLPGVGAFADGMRELNRRGLADLVRESANRKLPLLGICLGMQMLLDRSEEFGIHEGLGIIEGENIPIASQPLSSDRKKIPHIGWNGLQKPDAAMSWEGTILEATPPETPVYFVHSFMAAARKKTAWLSEVTYCGVKIPAVIKLDNTYGCQFHPEKSGPCGLAIIRSFLNLAR